MPSSRPSTDHSSRLTRLSLVRRPWPSRLSLVRRLRPSRLSLARRPRLLAVARSYGSPASRLSLARRPRLPRLSLARLPRFRLPDLAVLFGCWLVRPSLAHLPRSRPPDLAVLYGYWLVRLSLACLPRLLRLSLVCHPWIFARPPLVLVPRPPAARLCRLSLLRGHAPPVAPAKPTHAISRHTGIRTPPETRPTHLVTRSFSSAGFGRQSPTTLLR